MRLNYAANYFNTETLQLLQELARAQQVVSKFVNLTNGAIMNTGENRTVLHHRTRNRQHVDNFYQQQLQRIDKFVAKVHSQEIVGSTNQAFEEVVQIGIGGSHLGPETLYLALSDWAVGAKSPRHMEAKFIANVDPDDAASVITSCNLARTLFAVVSKSGTTDETSANEKIVRAALEAAGLDPAKHIVAVTSETSPMAKSSDYLDSFYIDDSIGGRFSSTSAVGGLLLSLCFGTEVFERLLDGAHEADQLAMRDCITGNAALMKALLDVFSCSYLSYNTLAVLPYNKALRRFPAHLQQLIMESNGKSVNRYGEVIHYPTSPVVLGEEGTNYQHSFGQYIHQGTSKIFVDFIAFAKSQLGDDLEVNGSTNQERLLGNLIAQIVAMAKGSENTVDPNQHFPGGIPSSLIYGEQLNPEALGALLAFYENATTFTGFILNLNSYDQPGVELGKILTKSILNNTSEDPAILALRELFDF